MSFKVGAKVKGLRAAYNNALQDYEQFPYSGVIVHDFEDGSYLVDDDKGSEWLIEPGYWELETMELV